MGEAKRRREAAEATGKALEYRNHIKQRDLDRGNMMISSRSAIPVDIKVDVARVVCSVEFRDRPFEGGLCYFRAAIGFRVLRMLGWQPTATLGGVLFRAGPNPRRDVVAFCGSGNRGQMYQGRFLGHIWLNLDDDAIDFSCHEWPQHYTPKDDGLGEVHWECRPPSLIWASQDLFKWQPDGTPAIGEVWFCPWAGDEPKFAGNRHPFENAKEMFTDAVANNIERNISNFSLVERINDIRRMPQRLYATKWQHQMRAGSRLHD
jgi:hypothetical protein